MSQKNSTSTKENKSINQKITFFENIYYWFYYYFDKMRLKNSHPTQHAAMGLFTTQRIYNGICLFIFAHILFKDLTEKVLPLLNPVLKFIILVLMIIIVLAVDRHDNRLYLNRYTVIIEKYNYITETERRKYKIAFLAYTIGSLACVIIAFLLVTRIS